MKHTIEIPDNLLDKASKKRIKQLEKELASAKGKLERRDRKVASLKRDIDRLKGGEFTADEKVVHRIRELISGLEVSFKELNLIEQNDCICMNCGNEH